jgi:DNA ligase (NAD+)
MIDNLLKYLNVADFVQETIESKLTNKKILFSGTLKMARKEAQNLAQKHGAIILSAVSKNLDYLICGEDAGSKLTKAKELNITIISEEDFLNLISNM